MQLDVQFSSEKSFFLWFIWYLRDYDKHIRLQQNLSQENIKGGKYYSCFQFKFESLKIKLSLFCEQKFKNPSLHAGWLKISLEPLRKFPGSISRSVYILQTVNKILERTLRNQSFLIDSKKSYQSGYFICLPFLPHPHS